jgi:hypothetical protein
VGAATGLHEDAPVLGRLGHLQPERHVLTQLGQSVQGGLVAVGVEHVDAGRASDRYQEEDAPHVGVEIGDELGHPLEVTGRVAGDGGVDLCADAGLTGPADDSPGPVE